MRRGFCTIVLHFVPVQNTRCQFLYSLLYSVMYDGWFNFSTANLNKANPILALYPGCRGHNYEDNPQFLIILKRLK